MRKTREVLRLYFDLKLEQRQVARSANVSQSTVHEYLERFTAAGLRWPLPAEMTEGELEARLFPADPGKDKEPTAKRPLPDVTHIHEERQRTSTPPRNCCGKSIAPRIRTAITTAASAISTSA